MGDDTADVIPPTAQEEPPVRIGGHIVTRRDFIALMLVIMNESISVTMLLPFVGLLVVHVDPDLREADAGLVSGFVVGCFQVAQAISGPYWGRYSDKWGRKPMLALGLVGSGLFSLGFGMSTSLFQLLLFRFLYGFANGTAPLCKTMVADLTNKSTAAMGWTMTAVGWAVGATMGPAIGGLLYDPARHLSSSFEGTLFETHPALLPAVAGACYSCFALLIVFFVLPESNQTAQQPAWLSAVMQCECLCPRRAVPHAVLPTDDEMVEEPRIAAGPVETASEGATVETVAPVVTTYGLAEMIRDDRMRRFLIMYVFSSFINTSYTEVLPLLAILPRAEGGMGLSARPIGIIFAALAAESIVLNFMFPPVLRRAGLVLLLRVCFAMWGISIALTPCLSDLDWPSWPHGDIGIIAATAGFLVFRSAASNWSYSICSMGIGEASPKEHLGTAMSISHSCGNLARALLPPLSTMVFAWSVSSSVRSESVAPLPYNATDPADLELAASRPTRPFPFDKWFAFLLLGACCGVAASFSRGMSQDAAQEAPKADQTADDAVGAESIVLRVDTEEGGEEEEPLQCKTGGAPVTDDSTA